MQKKGLFCRSKRDVDAACARYPGQAEGADSHPHEDLTSSPYATDASDRACRVKKKLQDACTSRKGTPDPDSFEVVFEKTSQNPDVPKPYYVDGKLKCNLP